MELDVLSQQRWGLPFRQYVWGIVKQEVPWDQDLLLLVDGAIMGKVGWEPKARNVTRIVLRERNRLLEMAADV